jgi:hypothetical protein
MSSPPRTPTTPLNRNPTLSTASPNRPGATLENPLRSAGVRAHPNDEVFYVLDRAQGFIQAIAREAEDYRSIGYAVFDSYGNTVTQFDAAHRAVVTRHAEPDQAEAFYHQFDDIWEIIDMRQAMTDAGADETVHYSMLSFYSFFSVSNWLTRQLDFETRRWYKKKKAKSTPKGTPKQGGKLHVCLEDSSRLT